MVFHHFLRDVEAESCPAPALSGREVGFKNFRYLRGRYSAASVPNAHVDEEILTRATDLDPPFDIRGSLDRVNDHVLDRALDLDRVTVNPALLVAIRDDLNTVLGRD